MKNLKNEDDINDEDDLSNEDNPQNGDVYYRILPQKLLTGTSQLTQNRKYYQLSKPEKEF